MAVRKRMTVSGGRGKERGRLWKRERVGENKKKRNEKNVDCDEGERGS